MTNSAIREELLSTASKQMQPQCDGGVAVPSKASHLLSGSVRKQASQPKDGGARCVRAAIVQHGPFELTPVHDLAMLSMPLGYSEDACTYNFC